MDDMNTVVTLLTIAIVILSVVIIVLLATVIVVLIKVKKLVNDAKLLTHNLTAATKWLNPSTLFGELIGALRKNKK